MMNADPLDQRQLALAEKVAKVVNSSKKFARVTYTVDNIQINVDVQLSNPTSMDYTKIRGIIKFAYEKWGGAEDRIENLYAALSHLYSDSNIVVQELDPWGNGTTTYFNVNRPSQA